MRVSIHQLGKRFNRHWVFRNLSLELNEGDKLSVVGNNGSGKSTFIQCVYGCQTLSEGKLDFYLKNEKVSDDNHYKHVAIAAPYIDFFEELTLEEMIHYQGKFKHWLPEISPDSLPEIAMLQQAAALPIKKYSSGMKQRAKLMMALASNAQVLFLDEPTSNLDNEGVRWFHSMLEKFSQDRILIIGSNFDTNEISVCNQQIDIRDYKS